MFFFLPAFQFTFDSVLVSSVYVPVVCVAHSVKHVTFQVPISLRAAVVYFVFFFHCCRCCWVLYQMHNIKGKPQKFDSNGFYRLQRLEIVVNKIMHETIFIHCRLCVCSKLVDMCLCCSDRSVAFFSISCELFSCLKSWFFMFSLVDFSLKRFIGLFAGFMYVWLLLKNIFLKLRLFYGRFRAFYSFHSIKQKFSHLTRRKWRKKIRFLAKEFE